MDLITKITAPNPGVFTGGGTNTYLIGNSQFILIAITKPFVNFGNNAGPINHKGAWHGV